MNAANKKAQRDVKWRVYGVASNLLDLLSSSDTKHILSEEGIEENIEECLTSLAKAILILQKEE